jgi:hypothetical protein
MSGSDSQKVMWSYEANLDRRVPDDHSLWRTNRVWDLRFVPAVAAHMYGPRGNKSGLPELVLRKGGLLPYSGAPTNAYKGSLQC